MHFNRLLLVPSKIDVNLILNSQGYTDRYINDHQDKYNWFIDSIIRHLRDSEAHKTTAALLYSDILKQVLGDKYREVKVNLIKWGIVKEVHPHLSKALAAKRGEKPHSIGYAITDEYTSKVIGRMILKEQFALKLAMFSKQWFRDQKVKGRALNYIKDNLKHLRIKDKEAIDFIDKKLEDSLELLNSFSDNYYENYKAHSVGKNVYEFNEKNFKEAGHLETTTMMISNLYDHYNSDYAAIQNLSVKVYHVSVDQNTGRIYTNLTNLSRDLRNFLYYAKKEGVQLVNIDLRNSQPFLLSILIKDYYKERNKPLPEDCQHYIDLTSNGELYEFMADALGVELTESNRKEFKGNMFGEVVFCKSGYTKQTISGKKFIEIFPNVIKVMNHYKAMDTAEVSMLPRILQKAEADIMIRKIVRELMESKILLSTIHDSIVTLATDAEIVEKVIIGMFEKEHQLYPTVSRDLLTILN